MRYPIAIEIGTETASYGVVVPELPGCFSAGDTIDDAVTAAEEAAAGWIDATLEREALFRPRPRSRRCARDRTMSVGHSASWRWTRLRSIVPSNGSTLRCRAGCCFASTPRHAKLARAVPTISRI
jgi:predicted RNase H-like HicB family nuclease